ncbi:MAG: type 1 glutamine amidotransferase [Candidatus Latescibacteria bacterium]|nr:type 1 glutamine amidotransferase [Candidatus Latescibacterota bacterium]
MKVHYLQHVAFEGPAGMVTWIKDRHHDLTGTLLFCGGILPSPDDFDMLAVLGGPMGVSDEDRYPWLVPEKHFIEKTVSKNKIVLGICLGAQLIAQVLGASVYPNDVPEMGWYPVSLTGDGKKSPIFSSLPGQFIAFHWHNDTFSIPPGSTITAKTGSCVNQAFEYNKSTFGLQFHLESTKESVGGLVENCKDDIVPGPFVQKPEIMILSESNFKMINTYMITFLDSIIKSI